MCNCNNCTNKSNKCTNQLQSNLSTDLELLYNILFYLNSLLPLLPDSRLHDHCAGAFASIFELRSFLILNKLSDYGNNEK